LDGRDYDVTTVTVTVTGFQQTVTGFDIDNVLTSLFVTIIASSWNFFYSVWHMQITVTVLFSVNLELWSKVVSVRQNADTM